jgi:F-type H+-transporting ATPase subunit b
VPRGPEPAHAEEAEESEDAAPQDVNWTDFGNKAKPPYLAAFINVALVAFLYVYLGKKPIAAALKARRDEVSKQIEEAQAIKHEAEARSLQYAAKLEKLGQEVETTKAGLLATGDEERARIVREAEEKAARLQKDAMFLLEQERRQLRIDLQRDAVADAVASAEQILRTRLTPADHERLAEEFLATLAAPGAGAVGPTGGAS